MTGRRTREGETCWVGWGILGTVTASFSASSLFHDSDLLQFALNLVLVQLPQKAKVEVGVVLSEELMETGSWAYIFFVLVWFDLGCVTDRILEIFSE